MTDEQRTNEERPGDEQTGEERTIETAQEARQGRRGIPVLVILVVALILAGVVWWGVGIYGARIDEEQPAELPKATDQPPEAQQSGVDAPSPEAAEPPEQESRSPDAQ